MGGRIVPAEYWGDFEPAWRNFFENTAAVQFHHRALALTTLSAVTAYWAGARGAALPPRVRLWVNALLGMAGLQARFSPRRSTKRMAPLLHSVLSCFAARCTSLRALRPCAAGDPGHHHSAVLRACGAGGRPPGEKKGTT